MANERNQPLDMDPTQEVSQDASDAIADVVKRYVVPLNPRAVMPDGRLVSREQILELLKLNPKTPPDAWLAIVACGSNASALNFPDARALATKTVMRAAATLQAIEKLGVVGGGRDYTDKEGSTTEYAAGGTAPGGEPQDPKKR